VDRDQMKQVFYNILRNAMQAMPDGGRIGVSLRAEGGQVRVEIEDAGPGIPADLSDKIWDPFFTTKDKGTGLGLGIVKNIVEAHGGTIHIANREPQGARVTIDLPARKPESDG
jgi:signal transduction histidine kinase